ncbi:NUDIX domain-containing protein [Caloranaerobacter azorensis]
MFYAGIGGHLEEGESFLECAHREAKEEIGVDIEIISSDITYYISESRVLHKLNVKDYPRPLAIFKMIHPKGTPREGQIYYILIYNAKLKNEPTKLKRDEVQGLIALTEKQVILSLERKPTLRELKEEGAIIVLGTESINDDTILYPIGTAKALAYILSVT